MLIRPDLLKLKSIIREKSRNETVPLSDYLVCFNEMQRIRATKIGQNPGEQQMSTENLFKKLELLKEQVGVKDEQIGFLQTSISNIVKSLDMETDRYHSLAAAYGKLEELFNENLIDRKKIENQLVEASKQRDEAESQIIQINLKRIKEQSELEEQLSIINQERNRMIEEKRLLNAQKLQLKVLLEKAKSGKLTSLSSGPRESNLEEELRMTDSNPSNAEDILEVNLTLTKTKSVQIHKVNDSQKKNWIMAMSLNTNQKLLATCGLDNRIVISDITKGLTPEMTFHTPETINTCVEFLDKQRLLIVGTQNKDVDIYDIPKGRRIQKLKSHSESVNSVAVIDDVSIVSGSADRTIKLWDLKRNALVHSFLLGSVVQSIQSGNNLIFSAHYDGSIKIASVNNNKTIFDEKVLGEVSLNYVKFVEGSNELFVAGQDHHFGIFDLRMMRPRKLFVVENENIYVGKKCCFGVDSQLSSFWAGTTSGEIAFVDLTLTTPKIEKKLKVSNSFEAEVPFVLNSQLTETVISADFDGFVHLVKYQHSI